MATSNKDIFTAIVDRLRLHELNEYSCEELQYELNRRRSEREVGICECCQCKEKYGFPEGFMIYTRTHALCLNCYSERDAGEK